MSRYVPEDLEPIERRTHELLASMPPHPLPIGFRDRVMQRIGGHRVALWEWLIAAALALPSLAFLIYQGAVHGDEFASVFNNVLTTASAETAEAFFFIDGTTVLALALVGVASLIAVHAAIAAPARKQIAR